MRVSRVVTDLILDGSRSSCRLVIQITGYVIPVVSVHEEQYMSSLRMVGTSREQSSWREDEREETNIIISTSEPLGTKPNSPVPNQGVRDQLPLRKC